MSDLLVRDVDALARRHRQLRRDAVRDPLLADELAECERQLVDCVRVSSGTAAAAKDGPGYHALWLLLYNDLDQLVDFISMLGGGADGEDLAIETIQAVVRAYSTTIWTLSYGLGSLRAYTRVAARRRVHRHLNARRAVPTAPEDLPDAPALHEGEPATLDLEVGRAEFDTWRAQVLHSLVQPDPKTTPQPATEPTHDPGSAPASESDLEHMRDMLIVYHVSRSSLSNEELAALTGVSPARIASYKNRALGRFIDNFAALWVARTRQAGPADSARGCRELTGLLTSWDPRPLNGFTYQTARTVRRHVSTCSSCQAEYEAFKRARVHILNRFRAAPPVLATPGLRRWMRSRTDNHQRRQALLDALTRPRRNPTPPADTEAPDTPAASALAATPATTLSPGSSATAALTRAFTPLGTGPARLLHQLAATAITTTGGDPTQFARILLRVGLLVAAAVAGTAAFLGTRHHPGAPTPTTVAAALPASAPPSPTPFPLAQPTPPFAPPAPPSPSTPPGRATTPVQSANSSPTPSATPPPHFTASPDLTGNWELDFTPTNYGGTSQGVMHPYTINLQRLDDSKCVNTSPCYGGTWWNVPAARPEGFATISVTVSGNTLNLLDTEPPDYPYNGPQYYTGTAPNNTTKPMTFSGSWQQYAPNDTTITPPGNHTRTATFTLTQGS